jgi:hypothetical protein
MIHEACFVAAVSDLCAHSLRWHVDKCAETVCDRCREPQRIGQLRVAATGKHGLIDESRKCASAAEHDKKLKYVLICESAVPDVTHLYSLRSIECLRCVLAPCAACTLHLSQHLSEP